MRKEADSGRNLRDIRAGMDTKEMLSELRVISAEYNHLVTRHDFEMSIYEEKERQREEDNLIKIQEAKEKKIPEIMITELDKMGLSDDENAYYIDRNSGIGFKIACKTREEGGLENREYWLDYFLYLPDRITPWANVSKVDGVFSFTEIKEGLGNSDISVSKDKFGRNILKMGDLSMKEIKKRENGENEEIFDELDTNTLFDGFTYGVNVIFITYTLAPNPRDSIVHNNHYVNFRDIPNEKQALGLQKRIMKNGFYFAVEKYFEEEGKRKQA